MSETLRAFVAVRVPSSPPLHNVLGELAALGRPVKPIAAENLHLTLKFLGNTDRSWLPDIERVLGELASKISAFDVTLQGLGAFPKPSRPSVIWTGMTPPEPVIRLAGDVESTLATFGFSPETRPFHPHVTVARIKNRPPRELAALLERHAETEFAAFSVNEIALVQSELTPDGARYTPLSIAPLAPTGGPNDIPPNAPY